MGCWFVLVCARVFFVFFVCVCACGHGQTPRASRIASHHLSLTAQHSAGWLREELQFTPPSRIIMLSKPRQPARSRLPKLDQRAMAQVAAKAQELENDLRTLCVEYGGKYPDVKQAAERAILKLREHGKADALEGVCVCDTGRACCWRRGRVRVFLRPWAVIWRVAFHLLPSPPPPTQRCAKNGCFARFCWRAPPSTAS